MVEKRKSITSTQSTPRSADVFNKRRKVLENGSPALTPTKKNGQPDLTEHAREQLLEWLDSRAQSTGVPFPIQYLPRRKKAAIRKKKGQATAPVRATIEDQGEDLRLNGHSYGRVQYVVQNQPKWEQLTRYKKCSVGEETIQQGECVLVNGDQTTDPENSEDFTLPQWKAQVLEVRALDQNHVYVKVAWLYRPAHDIPGGPTSYHGKYELVPSTEISIIDAASLNGSFKLKFWDEYEDDDVPVAEQYYWRHTCDHLKGTLSPCRQCKHCEQWLHAACLEEQAVQDYIQQNPMTNGEGDEVESGADSPPEFPTPDEDTDTIGVVNRTPTAEKISATIDMSAEDAEGAGVEVTVTDHRRASPVQKEMNLMCLFKECGKRIDD
ncbi:hypothetical protein MBLNU457_7781t1 [Dothideomycetes sp. NU457]